MILDLEGIADKGRIRSGLQCDLLFLVLRVQCGVLAIFGGGQVPDDSVQDVLHALVLHGRAHQQRAELPCDSSSPNRSVNGILWNLLVLKVYLRKLIIKVCEHLEELGAHLGNTALQLLWNVADALGEAMVTLEVVSLPCYQVAHPDEAILLADGDLDRMSRQSKLLADLLEYKERIGTISIQLVDEDDPWDLIAFHLPIHGDRLALNATNAAAYHDGTIKHAQRPLHFYGEVDVARGVNKIEVVVDALGFP
mmetsp:Transcript_85330/g.226538  ORF Transcript_85330/g.226538 Transcript_85330/m.226538 type:complete len:252 (+) Transcript_85330:1230-1985(+)